MNIWIANKPQPGSIRPYPHIPNYRLIDCTVGNLSPENIGPVYDYNGVKCENLHNFMEYIKVSIYHDDNGPVESWNTWRLNGFKKKEIYTHKAYLYSYNGRKLDWLEERELFKDKIKKHIDLSDLPMIFQTENILLMDYNVPNLGRGFLFQEDLMINKRNYKYSHVYAIAELLLGK